MIIISFQISFEDIAEKKQKMSSNKIIKILSLNLQSPSQHRAEKQMRWLISLGVQVLVLTEIKSLKTLNYIKSFLEFYEHNVVYHLSDSYITLIAVKGMKYEPLLLSEIGIDNSRVAGISLKIGDQFINLFGLYVPTCGRNLEKFEIKKKFQEKFISSINKFDSSKKQNYIFIGDFNVLEPNHRPFYYEFQQWTYFYNFFLSIDCIDAFRYKKGNVKEYSWSRGGVKQRLDHAFVSKTIIAEVLDCSYIQEPVNMHLSDHAAILLEFKDE